MGRQKRDKKENMQHYYFDTSILIGYINPKEGRDSSERAKNIIRASLKAIKRNSQIKIIIPTVVLGEIIQQLNEILENSEWMDALGKLLKFIKDCKTQIDFPSPGRSHYELALKILERDDRFESMDALIIAHPILDENSKKFYSFDSMFISSKIISELKDEYNSKFEIES